MDLMTLAAKITLDDSGFNKGVNQAEKTGKELAGKMTAMTVAVGNIAADLIRKGATAIKGIVDNAVDGYANYEQLIGGVETLFKSSADKVANYAAESYKTTGLSMNQYMETVTSFSASLLQGLQGNTSKAADIANMAITDMADNANKMGTDISSIQTAYQGFAKQNYTMLDNLKLGYGGTREEMIRLINDSGVLGEEISSLDNVTFDQILQAIHEIQTQMGITGTTSKEAASTISGSKNSLKAAFEDLLAAVGGAGGQERFDQTMENFKKSFSTYMENFIPTLLTTITNSGGLVGAIADSIADLPTTLLADIGDTAMKSGSEMINGVGKIANWLIDSMVNVFGSLANDNSSAEKLGAAIGDFLGSAIGKIAVNLPTIANGILNLGIGLASGLVDGLMQGLFGTGQDSIAGTIARADEELNEGIKEAEQSATRAQGIIDYLKDLAGKYGDAAKESREWKKAMDELDEALPGMGDWVSQQKGDIDALLAAMDAYIEKQKQIRIEAAKERALQSKNQAWIDALGALWEAQSEIDIQKSQGKEALANLAGFINGVSGNKDFTGEGLTADQVKYAAEQALQEKYPNGAGDTGYAEDKAMLDAWTSTLQTSESTIATLEASLSGLESNVIMAETAYLTSAAAVDNLSGSASSAAAALAAIKTPSIGFSGGQYANWYYGGQRYMPRATGIYNVPYDGFRTELHKEEMVLTKGQARQLRNGSSGGGENMTDAINNAVANAMSQVFVMLNGEKVGDLTTKRIKKNINASTYNKLRAMGG